MYKNLSYELCYKTLKLILLNCISEVYNCVGIKIIVFRHNFTLSLFLFITLSVTEKNRLQLYKLVLRE